MILWQLYYGDGSRFSNIDGTPAQAPRRGVVAAAWYDEDRLRRITHSTEFYWWKIGEQRWYGGDQWGLWDYICEHDLAIVKFGRTIGDFDFRKIIVEATNDLPLALADTVKRETNFSAGVYCASCQKNISVNDLVEHLSPSHKLEPGR